MLKFSIFLTILLYAQHARCLWDYAVTAKTKIVFYDEHWREITTSAHQFDHLSAIAFDETEEIVYFADRLHNNGSIFSLKIPLDQENSPHIIEKIVQRNKEEIITGIAYDPLNRNVYWVDQLNRKIHFTSIDASENDEPKTLIDFSNETTVPDGIAIDICRRKIYWTNSYFKNASIESMDLSGDGRRIIRQKDLYKPRGIVVDQLSDRIYYVVDQQGIHYTVESLSIDAKNMDEAEVIVKGLDSTPSNLAVTRDLIFWTDHRHNAVWMHSKWPSKRDKNETETDVEETNKPNIVIKLAETPSGIVTRTRFMTTLQNDQHCSGVVKKIKHLLLNSPQKNMPTNGTHLAIESKSDYCLNGGEYIAQSGICICKIGFKGARCETNECHNYCVHGTCTISYSSFPKCTCQRGFYGERCQSYRCSGFCFNDGVCKIESNGEASCECPDSFGGQRCEQNSTEICSLFCRILKYEPDAYAPYGCHDICQQLVDETEDGAQIYAIPTYKHLEVCHDQVTWTNTLIISLIAGIVLCLTLVLLIVHGVRRFYKPARPRIKKTFVVRRQPASSSDTPLTNRPIATEQCEITIENCCNMNYCDTPCFDPKLVQQTLSCDSANTKEDKKVLIHNMEDDLY